MTEQRRTAMPDLEPSHVSIRTEGDVVVIVPVGDFDLSNLASLRDALVDATSMPRSVVLDLAETTFVDSTVLGAITGAYRKADRVGGCLRIARPRPNIRRILQLMALDTIIGLYDSVEAAAAEPCTPVSDAG